MNCLPVYPLAWPILLLVSFKRLWWGLLAIAWVFPVEAARADAAPQEAKPCQLVLEIRNLEEDCGRGGTAADSCPWIGVLQNFVEGENRAAEARLVAAFGVSQELAPRIVAAVASFTLLLVDSNSCQSDELTKVLRRMLLAGPLQEAARSKDSLSAALIFRLFPLDPKVSQRLAPALGAAATPEVSRALDGFCSLLDRAGLIEGVRKAVNLDALMEGAILDRMAPPVDAKEGPFEAALAETDEALDDARHGRIGEARDKIASTVARAPTVAKGFVLARPKTSA